MQLNLYKARWFRWMGFNNRKLGEQISISITALHILEMEIINDILP